MFRIVLFVMALVAGGGAAWLALAVQPKDAPVTEIAAPVPPIAMQEVLVAAADLGQGNKLSEENVRWQPWPEDAMNAGFISRSVKPEASSELNGSVVRSQIAAGEPIREDKLVQSDSGFLSAILPSGKRAVAVRISAENTAGGFILPNDRVDVLHTVSQAGESGGQNTSVSQAILRNVRVLAIDQSADGANAETSVAIGKTATLELDPAEAEVIAAAEASGLLSLALRSAADADEVRQQVRPVATTVRVIRAGRTEFVKVN